MHMRMADAASLFFFLQVRLEEVLLRFDASFHASFIAGLPMSITFTFNRMPLRREHEALSPAKLPREAVLFPRPSVGSALSRVMDSLTGAVAAMGLGAYGAIKGNAEQVLAVQAILRKSSGDRPYLVFGPPGTGKTTTVIEGALGTES